MENTFGEEIAAFLDNVLDKSREVASSRQQEDESVMLAHIDLPVYWNKQSTFWEILLLPRWIMKIVNSGEI